MSQEVAVFSTFILAMLFLFMSFEYDDIEPEHWMYGIASAVMVLTGFIGLIVAGVR